jgi:hypothetical protein
MPAPRPQEPFEGVPLDRVKVGFVENQNLTEFVYFFEGNRGLLAHTFMPKFREICIHHRASAWRMRLAQQITRWHYVATGTDQGARFDLLHGADSVTSHALKAARCAIRTHAGTGAGATAQHPASTHQPHARAHARMKFFYSLNVWLHSPVLDMQYHSSDFIGAGRAR